MSYPLSRLMSAATAGYAGFALAKPSHLGEAMQASSSDRSGYDLLAQTYGVRDVAVSALGIFGKSPKTVKAAMLVRIAFDLGDGAVLSARAENDDVRKKVLAVTMGWAALNTLALAIDSATASD